MKPNQDDERMYDTFTELATQQREGEGCETPSAVAAEKLAATEAVDGAAGHTPLPWRANSCLT